METQKAQQNYENAEKEREIFKLVRMRLTKYQEKEDFLLGKIPAILPDIFDEEEEE